MKQRLVVFRALPIVRDSRVSRYKSLNHTYDVALNTWEDKYPKVRGIEKLKLGRKYFPKFISYPFYLLYLFFYSLFKLKSEDVAICMELDTFIPVYLGSILKNNKIYFDIVDPISQTKFKSVPFNKLFDYLEVYILKKNKYNILPNQNRIKYYEDRLGIPLKNINYSIVENVPQLSKKIVLNKNTKKKDFLTIGYFGTLEKERGLIELINYVKKTDSLKLIIAGKGKLEDYIALNKVKNKIYYMGAFNPSELNELYNRVDFIWSYYSDNIFLHQYASPNKYYEHLAFKTPIIINKIVPQSKKILNMDTGIVIGNELNSSTFNILLEKMMGYNYSYKKFSLWEAKYKNYIIRLKM